MHGEHSHESGLVNQFLASDDKGGEKIGFSLWIFVCHECRKSLIHLATGQVRRIGRNHVEALANDAHETQSLGRLIYEMAGVFPLRAGCLNKSVKMLEHLIG